MEEYLVTCNESYSARNYSAWSKIHFPSLFWSNIQTFQHVTLCRWA